MKLAAFKRGWRQVVFFPVALALWPLVLRNLSLRRAGILPDEWYWADAMLLCNGYVVHA